MMFLSCAAVFVASCLVSVQGLSTSDLTTLDDVLEFVVRGSEATMVRLAFHDCVGGCDGCLNVDNPDNAGLSNLVESLETAYTDNSFSTLLSRADFWAYAGQYALKHAITWTNEDHQGCSGADDCKIPDLNLTFQTGRVDCATAPYTDVDNSLPGPHLTYPELTSFYAERFGMNEEEAVAIMGAHTLGGAKPENSGFKGTWIREGSRNFNNEYYTALLNGAWIQRNSARRDEDAKYQWDDRATGFMLNSDMCLLKEIELNDDGQSSCDYASCANSGGAEYVQKFADSLDTWMEKFAEAFTIMQAAGDFTLTDLED